MPAYRLRTALAAFLTLVAAAALATGASRARADAIGTWSSLDPLSIRSWPAVVVDPYHDRLLVIGYTTSPPAFSEILACGLEPPTSWETFQATNAPSDISDARAVYDPLRSRVLLLGNRYVGGVYVPEVWALPLTGAPAWSQLATTGTPPSRRNGSSVIFDPIRDRLVIFAGGGTFTQPTNELWELSLSGTPTWTQLAPAGPLPAARSNHSANYDPVADRMIVFGGTGSFTARLNDVWELSLGGPLTWAQIQYNDNGAIPAGRSYHAAAFDPTRHTLFIRGGTGGSGAMNDLWALPLSGPDPTWEPLTPAGSGPTVPTIYHAAAFDLAHDQVAYYDGGAWAMTIDAFDQTAWVPLAPKPPTIQPPPSWARAVGVLDHVNDRFIVGGSTNCFPAQCSLVEAFSLSGTQEWSVLPILTWSFPQGVSFAKDDARNRLIMFNSMDGHLFEFYQWESQMSLADGSGADLAATGDGPSGIGNAAIYDPGRDRVVSYGGWDGTTVDPSTDMWELLLQGPPAWTLLVVPGTPVGGYPIYDPVRDRMLLVGDAVWGLPFTSAVGWTEVVPPGTGIVWGATIYDPVRDRIVVTGDDGSTWVLPMEGTTEVSPPPVWSQTHPPDPDRTNPIGIYDARRDRMVVLGDYGVRALTFGTPSRPVIECASDNQVWTAGATLPLSFTVHHELTSVRAIAWKLESARGWPGLPQHGILRTDGGVPQDVTVDVAVPDSAAAGVNVLRFTSWLSGGPGYEAECTVGIADSPVSLGIEQPAPDLRLALEGPLPNPSRAALRMSVTLPDARPGRVELFDLSGRRVASRTVAGPGRRSVALGEGMSLAPGIYLIRLSHAGASVTRRGVVLQ